MEQNRLSDDFTEGKIAGKLLKFMIPILGALVLQAMYGAVDLLVVGQFGTKAGISAVSTGSNIINMVTFIITGLTMGVTVLISRYLGEKATERIGKVIGGAIVFFMALTIFFDGNTIIICANLYKMAKCAAGSIQFDGGLCAYLWRGPNLCGSL